MGTGQGATTGTKVGNSRFRPPTWGHMGVLSFIALCLLLVAPPVFELVSTSFTIMRRGSPAELGVHNYVRVIQSLGWPLWRTSITLALGSAAFSIGFGLVTAWLVARTDVPCGRFVVATAYVSLSAPVMVKAIGWILLLGPNNGLITNALRLWQPGAAPVELFSLGGMIFVEGTVWTPMALLLLLPLMAAIDPALEESATTCGASRWKVFIRINLPLAAPGIFALLLLSSIRAFEAFDVPLLIGVPGRLQTVTTALYQSMHAGFTPRYGEASAYSVMLLVSLLVPLSLYYRATRQASRFATISGKGFRPRQIELGSWRWPCAFLVLVIPASLLAPLLILCWASLLPHYAAPSLAELSNVTGANFAAVVTRNDTVAGLTNSFLVGTATATSLAVLSLSMSWTVARSRQWFKWAIDALASLPLVFPGIVLSLAVLVEFLYVRFIPIYGTIWIIAFAFLLKLLPYGMRFSYNGVLTIAPELEESARMSGASNLRVLRAVILPLAMPSVAALWIYVFMQAFRDLSVPALLTGGNNAISSMVILDLWNNGELSELAALCLTVTAVAGGLGLLLMRLSSREALARS